MKYEWADGRKVIASEWGGKVYGNQKGRFLYLYGTYLIQAHYRGCSLDVAIENPKLCDSDIQFIIEGDKVYFRFIKNGDMEVITYRKKDGSLDSVLVRDTMDARTLLIICKD